MSGAIGSISGFQYIPIQCSPSKWTSGLHGCCPRLSRTSPKAGPKPHLLSRRQKGTKKRPTRCRKLLEVLVIVLQDYLELPPADLPVRARVDGHIRFVADDVVVIEFFTKKLRREYPRSVEF